jgi:hypothetical protein
VRGNSGFGSLTRLARELRFAAKYSVDNKRVGILIAAVPIALSWLAYSAARAAVHGLLRPGVRRRSASLT